MARRNNRAAIAALQRQIERLRGLGDMAKDVAPAVRDELERVLVEQIAAGVGPDGKAWQRNADGTKPLRSAADRLTVRAIGTVVLARLSGPTALHNDGRAAGGIVRRILPTSKLPDRFILAVKRAANRWFTARMGA